MTFDEFYTKLQKIKFDFKLSTGRELETVADLEKYLDQSLVAKKTKGAKSLRGLRL